MPNTDAGQVPAFHRFRSLSAQATSEAVLFLDSSSNDQDLAENASQRINAARRLLEVTMIFRMPDADELAVRAVSEAAFLLLSDGCDLFNALAFRSLTDHLAQTR